MAIINQDFEKLITGHGAEKCDFNKLLGESERIRDAWENDMVLNASEINFHLDSDLRFHYQTDYGRQKEADITQFAFSQLCGRLGVPTGYVKKCFVSGKKDLALENFRAWASETDSNFLVRANNGVVRAVLSDKYAPFDSYQVLRNLKFSADLKRWVPTQIHLSEDRLAVRLVDFTPLPVNDGSPLYLGVSITSSDVGRAGLSVKVMLYRFACQNGLLVSALGGTLYQQRHIGEAMSQSKLATFSSIFDKVDTVGEAIIANIDECRNRRLKEFELEFLLEKVRRELKLSDKSVEKMNELVYGTYSPTKWGVINSITELAQQFTLETRLDMENFAGELLVAA